MDNMEALIKAADEGVYAAKTNGRNCVAAAPAHQGYGLPV
jgi:PleD family two-component response regulator